MSDVDIAYKGSSIAVLNASGVKTLKTKGKYCEDDITITYTSPGGLDDISWDQCPQAVRNYMENVNYSASDYSTTQVTSYAPSTPVSANTKPVGKTLDGVTYYNNIPNVKTPFASTNRAGTLKPLDQVRWINTVTNNVRDIGGWACDGGTVKYGLIYRGGDLHANDEDLFIRQLGINTEIDLTADGTPAYPGKMRFICHPSYAMYSLNNKGAWTTNLRAVFDAVIYGEPVIFHCSMGADRTGTLACILEALLGVSQSDVDKDYELTSFYAIRARNGNYQGGTQDWAHLIGEINALTGSTFRDKAINFVASLGFTAAEINAFRAAMIDGTPETISISPGSCSVTKTFENVSSSNSASSVTKYSRYQNDITANSGCYLTEASVSMGGVDISADVLKTVISGSVVSDQSNTTVFIDIPLVTAALEVTAKASTGARIPSAYQEVEWIGSSGTQTIRVDLDSTRVGAYIEQRIMRTNSGVRGLIGFASSSATDIGAAAGSYFGWNTSGMWEMGGSSVSNVSAKTNDFAVCKFEVYASGSCKLNVDGVDVTSRAGTGQYAKFLIFGGTSYKVSCKQQECKVYNSQGGGTMTAWLIPCYRKADSVIGMYDIVAGTFLENVGSGTFTKGADV